MAKTNSPTRTVVPCRISFANIWEPKSVNGSDPKGTFNPDRMIKRSEVAAIVVRMMDPTARVPAPTELGK